MIQLSQRGGGKKKEKKERWNFKDFYETPLTLGPYLCSTNINTPTYVGVKKKKSSTEALFSPLQASRSHAADMIQQFVFFKRSRNCECAGAATGLSHRFSKCHSCCSSDSAARSIRGAVTPHVLKQ